MAYIETKKIQERAVLVGIATGGTTVEKETEYLKELSFLVDTAGAKTEKVFMQRLDLPNGKFYIGSGKLSEVKTYVEAEKIDMVVFDDELSPAQSRNLEKELKCKVLDRTTLILDIFAKHARTAHARTQVELAQYQYLLPRLTGMWTHLSKQRGGVGMRGPGEKEIETDRRVIHDKITLLKSKLAEIDKQKVLQRKNRVSMVRVALVGYTNVGKSTIMNLVGKSEVLAENKLFATLDTTVRKVVIGNLPFLLSDTVGFIRKLPHSLVESFKSTLDEVRESDILLHVVDVSHPEFEEQMEIVRQTLAEIGAADKKTIVVFNKVDAYTYEEKDPDDLSPVTKRNYSLEDLQQMWYAKENAPCIFVSAVQKKNVEAFKQMLYEEVKRVHLTRYPYDKLLYDDYNNAEI
ncbi:MAG: GTPase HflX [Bacteroidales bacterium]|nr:GTPase HflX [Bacteroidales bacterium]